MFDIPVPLPILEQTLDGIRTFGFDLNQLTPTGHRSFNITLPDGSVLNIKGLCASPVGIFGPKAQHQLNNSFLYISYEGDYFGKATMDDVREEEGIYDDLERKYPGLFLDPTTPIWALIGVINTGNKLEVWRPDDTDPREEVILVRRFPFTSWRIADAFVVDGKVYIDKELERLQKLWNVSDRQGVYIKAIGRLSSALSILHSTGNVHGNLVWNLYDKNLDTIYIRPNNHNISLDGSIGDFELPIESYGKCDVNTMLRELLGSYSSYISLIARIDPTLISDSIFINRLNQQFKFSNQMFDEFLRSNNHLTEEYIQNYRNRVDLTLEGKKVQSGIEYFDSIFFAQFGPAIIDLTEKLIRR